MCPQVELLIVCEQGPSRVAPRRHPRPPGRRASSLCPILVNSSRVSSEVGYTAPDPWPRCIVHRSCTKRPVPTVFSCASASIRGLASTVSCRGFSSVHCDATCRRFGLTYVEMARPPHDEHHQVEATMVLSRWQAIECTSVPTSLGVHSWCAL